ncbi:MAG: branched-chain amino acid transaminase [Candidatus Tyrphobacter sp.]
MTRRSLSETIVYAGGDFARYGDSKVGLLTHGLQYGTGCFEGIRGYWSAPQRELYLVQLREHYDRLAASAKILLMELPLPTDDLVQRTVELCTRNAFDCDIYVRPCIFKAAEDVGVRLHEAPSTFAIVPLPFTSYLDKSRGVRACVSSWRRADDTMVPPRAKITGLYVNSALAKSDAIADGYDEAIMLSHDGRVSEGSAENIFIVRRGVLHTPDVAQNILEGCTRRAVMQIACDAGIEVVERAISRGELYAADEAFFSGTAAGIAYIGSIDRRSVGDGTMGSVTRRISQTYENAVTGRDERYARWLTRVYGRSPAPVA